MCARPLICDSKEAKTAGINDCHPTSPFSVSVRCSDEFGWAFLEIICNTHSCTKKSFRFNRKTVVLSVVLVSLVNFAGEIIEKNEQRNLSDNGRYFVFFYIFIDEGFISTEY